MKSCRIQTGETFTTYPKMNVVCQRGNLSRELRVWYAVRFLFCTQDTPGYFKPTGDNLGKIQNIIRNSQGDPVADRTLKNILNGGDGIFWTLDRGRQYVPGKPGKIKAVRIFTPDVVAYHLEPYRKKFNLNLGILVNQSAKGKFHSPITDLYTFSDFLKHIIKNTVFAFSETMSRERLERFLGYCSKLQGDTWKYEYIQEFIYEGLQASQKNIGKLLGLTRQTVAKYLKQLPRDFLDYAEYEIVHIDGERAEYDSRAEAQAVRDVIRETADPSHSGYYVVQRSNGKFQVQRRESTKYQVDSKVFQEKNINIPGLKTNRMRKEIRRFLRMFQYGLPNHLNTGSATGGNLNFYNDSGNHNIPETLYLSRAHDINIPFKGNKPAAKELLFTGNFAAHGNG